jgi:hypothetical protein
VVVKLNPSGSAVVYATYIGEAGTDSATKLNLDSTGEAYVLGSSGSADFPYTSGAYRASPSAAQGMFVAKLNAAGALVYSAQAQAQNSAPTPTTVTSIAVDSGGRAIYAGATADTALPVTMGAFQSAYGGGGNDGFIGALTPTGSGLSFLTYLGGNFDDSVTALALDSSGTIVAAGFEIFAGPFLHSLRRRGEYFSDYARRVSQHLCLQSLELFPGNYYR